MDTSGNIYAANWASIEKFTPAGVPSFFADAYQPRGIAFDKSGNLYAADWGYQFIEKFAPDGTPSIFASYTGLNMAFGIAIDNDGFIYASYPSVDKIEIFAPGNGAAHSDFATTGLSSPYGLAFDSAGYLYAVNYTGKSVTQINSSGSGQLYFNTDYGAPTFIAFQQPAPEPASLSLLALGTASLLLRRKTKRG